LLTIEERGVEELRRRLVAAGRVVAPRRAKTFDLTVDGVDAEVKVRTCTLRTLDFIGLTDAQQRAVRSGHRFAVYIVCTGRRPSTIDWEIAELNAAQLADLTPKVEATHYYYATQIRELWRAC